MAAGGDQYGHFRHLCLQLLSSADRARDGRSFGAFSAFLVALFTEMYGFPLTIYLLSGWLQSQFPGIDPFSHDAGHLPEVLLGWTGDPHFSPLHVLSYFFIFGGFVLLSAAWRVLYKAHQQRQLAEWHVPGAERESGLATTGPYAHVRHPQYVGFVLIMIRFLLQWPMLVTLAMFPILVTMYVRLARREERETLAQFGEEYARYMPSVPAFIPLWPTPSGISVRAEQSGRLTKAPCASRNPFFGIHLEASPSRAPSHAMEHAADRARLNWSRVLGPCQRKVTDSGTAFMTTVALRAA